MKNNKHIKALIAKIIDDPGCNADAMLDILKGELPKQGVYALAITSANGSDAYCFTSMKGAEKAKHKSVQRVCKKLKDEKQPIVLTLNNGTATITSAMTGNTIISWTPLYQYDYHLLHNH